MKWDELEMDREKQIYLDAFWEGFFQGQIIERRMQAKEEGGVEDAGFVGTKAAV